jgi:hypothetical protein
MAGRTVQISDVFMYEGKSHGDAEFIPNDIWREMQSNFPGYQLEERQGLAETVSRGQAQEFPLPSQQPARQPVLAQWKSRFLKKRVN